MTVEDLPMIMTAKETAEFLRLDVKTVRESAAQGQLPARKVGRRLVIYRDALLDWLRSSDADGR